MLQKIWETLTYSIPSVIMATVILGFVVFLILKYPNIIGEFIRKKLGLYSKQELLQFAEAMNKIRKINIRKGQNKTVNDIINDKFNKWEK